eukprot:scaffold187_cov266-Chaetoceros_neogracile.AAC.26
MNVLQERNSISGMPTLKRSRSQIDENKKCDIQHWNLNGQIENGNLELIKPSRKIYQGEGTYQPRIDSPKRNNSKASKKNPISIGSSSSAAHYDSFPEEDIMSPIGSSSPCPFKSRCDSCASPTANNNKDCKKKTSMLPNRDAPVQLVSAQMKMADCKKEVVTHGRISADCYFDSSSDEDEDTPMSRIVQNFDHDSQKQHTDIMVFKAGSLPAQHPNVDDTICSHHFDKNGSSMPGSSMSNTRVGANVPHVLHTNLYNGPQHAAEVLFKKEWQASLVTETLAREVKEDHVAAEALAMQEVEERLAAETWSLARAIENDRLLDAEILFDKEEKERPGADAFKRKRKRNRVETLAMQEVEERLAAETCSLARAIEDDRLLDAEILFDKEETERLASETLARVIKDDNAAAKAIAMQEVEECLATESWSLARAIEDERLVAAKILFDKEETEIPSAEGKLKEDHVAAETSKQLADELFAMPQVDPVSLISTTKDKSAINLEANESPKILDHYEGHPDSYNHETNSAKKDSIIEWAYRNQIDLFVATKPPPVTGSSHQNKRLQPTHFNDTRSKNKSVRRQSYNSASSMNSASTRSLISETTQTLNSYSSTESESWHNYNHSLVGKHLTVGNERQLHDAKMEDTQLFFPKENQATELLQNKRYVMMFLPKPFSQQQSSSEIMLEDFIASGISTKEDGLNEVFLPSVRQLTRTLIDAMGFDYSSKDYVGDVTVPLKPLKGKPAVRSSAVMTLINIRLEFLKESNVGVACYITEEVAFAYRLAAHFTLISCSRLREYHKKDYKRVKSITKIQNRALLTLLVSLRGILTRLLREDHMNNNHTDSAVSRNIRCLFQTDQGEDFSPAEVLWTDCVSLLTEDDPDIGILDDKTNAHLVETLLKMDKEVSMRQTVSFSKGLMELLFRQLIAKEVAFVGSNGPIKNKMVKLSLRVRKYSDAMACVLDNTSIECKVVIKNLLKLRENQRARFQMEERNNQILPPVNSVMDIEDKAIGEDYSLRMEGCTFLSMVIDQHRVSTKSSPSDAYDFVRTKEMEQMAFYLFHLLMENDPFPQITADGGHHPISISRRFNLKSAVLAAFLLASKALESPISMRHLLTCAMNGGNAQTSQNTNTNTREPGQPLRDLIKLYERHLMILNGYDAPKLTRLSYSSITEVSELLSLEKNDIIKFERVFGHFGVKYSSSCLIEEPLLLAFAVYRFGCKHLHILRTSIIFDKVLGRDEKRMVELLADHMQATFALSLSSPPQLSGDRMLSLSSLCDQLNTINEC